MRDLWWDRSGECSFQASSEERPLYNLRKASWMVSRVPILILQPTLVFWPQEVKSGFQQLGVGCGGGWCVSTILLSCLGKAGLLAQHNPEVPAAPQSPRSVVDGQARAMGRLIIAAKRQALCYEKWGGWVVLTAGLAPQHFHLCAGTDGAAAAVGTACVGPLVTLLNIAYDQASVLGQVDMVAVCLHGDSVPTSKKHFVALFTTMGAKGALRSELGNWWSVNGVNFYEFSRKEEEIFCYNLSQQLGSNLSLRESASVRPLSA